MLDDIAYKTATLLAQTLIENYFTVHSLLKTQPSLSIFPSIHTFLRTCFDKFVKVLQIYAQAAFIMFFIFLPLSVWATEDIIAKVHYGENALKYWGNVSNAKQVQHTRSELNKPVCSCFQILQTYCHITKAHEGIATTLIADEIVLCTSLSLFLLHFHPHKN